MADTILDRIMADVRREVEHAQYVRPVSELERMLKDAPPVRPFGDALQHGFGLVAEVKVRSPSRGVMPPENVAAAPAAYERSRVVRCISVLTNSTHFGMDITKLRDIKLQSTKPVLRKDFIYTEYQVLEARAFGADAVLLIVSLFEPARLQQIYEFVRDLGMDALFECHTRADIECVPSTARIYGINTRAFDLPVSVYEAARAQAAGGQHDPTTDLARLELGRHLPQHAIKVAESGLGPEHIPMLRKQGVYNAALVGTRLLTAREGLEAALAAFEAACEQPL
ncbi:MAG: indole-3-glycerol phosphate synthase TrpC [Verrucomicrobiae bacterium]|nr:indole-3-glycerol phosphate synthase TrpC [Verrucomicrobiae bacterium]